MMKTTLSFLFLALSLIATGAKKRDLEGSTGTTCDTNPCVPGGDLYLKHAKRRMYIQCGPGGECSEMKCPDGTRWNQGFLTCVHRKCGECNNGCDADRIAAGKLYRKHCKDPSKYRQCDKFGGCFVMDCPAGTVWKNSKKTCVHADPVRN